MLESWRFPELPLFSLDDGGVARFGVDDVAMFSLTCSGNTVVQQRQEEISRVVAQQ